MAAILPPPVPVAAPRKTPPPLGEAPPPSAPSAKSTGREAAPLRRGLILLANALKSWLLAALACLSLPFAVLFSGWTYRLVQRRAHRLWHKRLGQPDPDPAGRLLPRWFFSERFRENLARVKSPSPLDWVDGLGRAFLGSFGCNMKTGFLVVLNSMLLTLPGGLIMMFSWYSGWDNSFNKGYEQAAVGPLWGFVGIFLFMAAMTYVPVAQARQAATGSARAFWNYRKVRDVINDRPIACLFLAAGYTALGAVFMVAVSALMFIGSGEQFEEMTNAQIIAYLNGYYFWWALLFLVPGFVLLKLVAGRIYAGAAYEAITHGDWPREDLSGAEREVFTQARVTPSPPPGPGLVRTGLAAFSLIGRFCLRGATFVLLFVFAAELYIAQFFTFEPAANWLRQPLLQVPWFHSIPAHLKEE